MSFGTSIGDVILIVQLAWNTVQGAKQACGEHDELTREVVNLHKVLSRVRRELSRSPPGAENDERKKELDEHIAGCKHVLRVMNEVLVKYNALGEDKKKGRSLKRLWKKIEFANGEKSDLADIRSKLNTHTSALMMSLKLYTLGSLGRVEEQLGNQGGELKGIKESINWIAANMTASTSAAGDGSVWTTYENDDRAFWRELRRELHNDGFPRSALEKRKSLIKAYVKELGNRGVFDEDEDEDEETNFETHDAGGYRGKGKQRLETIQDDEDVENDSGDFKSSDHRGKFVLKKQEPLHPATEKGKSLADGFEEEIGKREASNEDESAGSESEECDAYQTPGHRRHISFGGFPGGSGDAIRDREDFMEVEKSRQTSGTPYRNREKGKQRAAIIAIGEAAEDDLEDSNKLKRNERKVRCSGFRADGTRRGCGRQFARHDDLTAHLQSGAGRLCWDGIAVGPPGTFNNSAYEKLRGEADEEGEDNSGSGNSRNMEVSENIKPKPEPPDNQKSDIYSELASSSDSEEDSVTLSYAPLGPQIHQFPKSIRSPKQHRQDDSFLNGWKTGWMMLL